MTTVRLKASDGFECPAYVAQPKGKPKGAVVVIQEIFGVNPHIREVADGYAAAGYFAIAPAMFHRAKHGVELGYTPDDMQAGMALKAAIEALPDMAFMADVQAAVKYAQQTSGAKVGIVGYCWGGLLTWRAAALVQGLSAAVPYYGGGSTTSEEIARHPNCPVMAHYAKQDHWIGLDTVETFSKAHPEVAVHLYEADHGFNCDHRGSYQKVSADLARERTLAFFEEHLA
jgi:carboxymethylenebutenolidase